MGFQGNPSPQQGCIRIPPSCSSSQDCPSQHVCVAGKCQCECKENSNCAEGERCVNGVCSKVCYGDSNCLTGELCINGVCETGCTSNAGCSIDQICINNKCKCGQGFIAGNEKCLDIDECEQYPCHASAKCINLRGSYRCICPHGTAGDPIKSGCTTPNHCTMDHDCTKSLACIQNSCTDPCSLADCGLNAICSVVDHTAVCQCQPGYIGDAKGCLKVECLSNNDCPGDKYCNLDTNKCASKD